MAFFSEAGLAAAGRGRSRPDYEKQVDKILFRYKDNEYTIAYIKAEIAELVLTGRRVVGMYEPVMTRPKGNNESQEEKLVQRKVELEEKLKALYEFQESVRRIIEDGLNDEERLFVRLYWLDVPPNLRRIKDRKQFVLAGMPYLHDRENDRTFYNWRNRIYIKLAGLLGCV